MNACLRVLSSLVLAVSLAVSVGQQLSGWTSGFQPLAPGVEAAVIGGSIGWTDCTTGTPACPPGAPPAATPCPIGVGPGGICPGTAWCIGGPNNMVCTATNWPGYWCATGTPAACPDQFLTCVAGSCSGTSAQGTNPTLCGTSTTCSN